MTDRQFKSQKRLALYHIVNDLDEIYQLRNYETTLLRTSLDFFIERTSYNHQVLSDALDEFDDKMGEDHFRTFRRMRRGLGIPRIFGTTQMEKILSLLKDLGVTDTTSLIAVKKTVQMLLGLNLWQPYRHIVIRLDNQLHSYLDLDREDEEVCEERKIKYSAPYNIVKAHPSDAGYDVRAVEDIVLMPLRQTMIDTGVIVETPAGYEIELVGRSGLASKGILAHVGTIDAGYRANIKVVLFNITEAPFTIKANDKVAQLKFRRVEPVSLEKTLFISTLTDRGTKGFGSSGTQ